MRILFLTTAHNSLSQRLGVELARCGHTISVCVAGTAEVMLGAMDWQQPDLVVAPMLKTSIPADIWRKHTCLIVHPGIVGDRGPSSLDWAISMGVERWGVTVLQADAEMDAGPIWASETFGMPCRSVTKSSLYRGEVTEAAVRAVLRAVGRVAEGVGTPEPLDYGRADVEGRCRPAMRQHDRSIDWSTDPTASIARRVRAADSSPGVLTTLLGRQVYAYGAHEEDRLSGAPGAVIGQRQGAVCVATVDGALWITHLKAKAAEHRYSGIKLPAAQVLGEQLRQVRHVDLPLAAPTDYRTYRDIRYWEAGAVGYLSFDFYNGAMSTRQCRRLRTAFAHARSRPTQVICLLGGREFWSNGIHLNTIEAAEDAARESWRNINAIDDLVLDILRARQLIVAGVRGNAGAGGCMLALAADRIYARAGVVLNPHYRTMGGLFGSEYWTYTLPRRVGAELARELTEACQPMGTEEACEVGLIDAAFGADVDAFERHLEARLHGLAADPSLPSLLAAKRWRRRTDERIRPLASYRAHELGRMADNFFGPDASYHAARHRFAYKLPTTPTGAANERTPRRAAEYAA